MAGRLKNMREQLILAGIEEINIHGVTEFSIRRVATACHVSCAAPYKHFKDKRHFIAAVIEHVNEQWHHRQQEVLERCQGGLREQIVEVCVPPGSSSAALWPGFPELLRRDSLF